VVAHMAIVAWRDFWSSEMINNSASRVETELSVPRLKRIDGLDGVRAFTRGGYLGALRDEKD